MHRASGLNAVDFLLGLIKGILGSCFQALRCYSHHARFLICAVRVTASIRFWVINATYALLRISRHYAFLTLVKCSGGQTVLVPREPLHIRHCYFCFVKLLIFHKVELRKHCYFEFFHLAWLDLSLLLR